MTKVTQPKLSRPKAEVVSKAAHSACWGAAEGLLRCLYLAELGKRSGGDYGVRAVDHARDLMDFSILAGGHVSPAEFLGWVVDREIEYTRYLDQARELCGLPPVIGPAVSKLLRDSVVAYGVPEVVVR